MRFASFVFACLFAAAPARAEVGSTLLFDMATGEVIAQHAASAPWYPASVTKLMTVFVTLEAVRDGKLAMTSPVRISAQASQQPPSKMGFAVGRAIPVEAALRILMTRSANDVSVALAEAVGGTQRGFVDAMNAAAARLNMTSTHYDNPHGLPNERQVTSARDLALLMMALAERFPEHGDLFAMGGITVGTEFVPNHNNLIRRFPGADGMKTGFICASGFNLAATATRDGRRLGAVVLGGLTAGERDERAAELLAKGFEAVRTGGVVALDGFGDLEARLDLAPVAGTRAAQGTVAELPAADRPARDRRAEVCGAARPRTRYDDGTVASASEVVAQRSVTVAALRARSEWAARRSIVLSMPRPTPVALPAAMLEARALADEVMAPAGWTPSAAAALPPRRPKPAAERELAQGDVAPDASDPRPTPAERMGSPSRAPRPAGGLGDVVALDVGVAAVPEPIAPADWVASPGVPPRNPLAAAGLRQGVNAVVPPALPLTYLSAPTPIVPLVVSLKADASRPAPLSGAIVGGGPPPLPRPKPPLPLPLPAPAAAVEANASAAMAAPKPL